MNKLFEPLFITRSKGIGLGLAVSKNLVRANGERIEMLNKERKESTFAVKLPLTLKQHTLRIMNDKLCILVVDDNHDMALSLVDIFRLKGYAAEAAYSGYEALEKMAQYNLDCVLSDIKMPGINGIELCRVIKAAQPDLPVVLMTASSSHGLVREGLREGAAAVLPKPLDIDLLLTFFSSLGKNARPSQRGRRPLLL
jgi:CheY-like chemotaxis protein